jgi:hypothetical protein
MRGLSFLTHESQVEAPTCRVWVFETKTDHGLVPARITRERNFVPLSFFLLGLVHRLCGLLLLPLPHLCPASALRCSYLVTCGSAHCAHFRRCRHPSCLRPARLLRERDLPARRCRERPFQSPRSHTGTIPPDEVPKYLDNLIQAIAFLLQFLQHPGEIRHGYSPPHVVLE